MKTFTSYGFAGLLALSVAQGAPQAKSRFTYYEMKTPLSGPCDLCTGVDNESIWVQDILVNKVARIDIKSGKVEEFTIPYTTAPIVNVSLPGLEGRTALACAIQPGNDGNLYAATGDRNQFLRINPKTKKITVFSPPNTLGNLEPFNDLWRGKTGMFFTQTTGNVVTHFDYKTEKFRNYEVPTPLAGPLGLIVASDGGVWFTEFLANKIGRLNATTGEFKEYPVPLTASNPAVMRAETEGRYLWFTGFVGNSIGRIDIQTGDVKVYPSNSLLSFPTEDTVDSKGHIWFSTATKNSINKLIPSTGKVVSIQQPDSPIPLPIGIPPDLDIAVHYGPDNAIWFTEAATNRVGRYQLV